MSSSLMAAAAPSRRLARAALLPVTGVPAVASGTRPSISRCPPAGCPSPCLAPSQPPRRYAARAPSLVRKEKALRAPPNPSAPPLFEASDVPPLELWERWERDTGELGGLAPAEAREITIKFAQSANKILPVHLALLRLDKNFNIPPRHLHCATIPIVFSGPPGKSGYIGLHMLLAAVALGHTPSTLLVADMFTSRRLMPGTDLTGSLKLAEADFKRILATENNPAAFTIAAKRAHKEGKPPTAILEYLDKAIAAGRDLPATSPPPSTGQQTADGASVRPPSLRGPKWSLEATCHHLRGAMLLKLGRPAEAATAFGIAARELDLVASCFQLAKLLPPDAPEREACLLRAAQAGHLDACRLLAEHWKRRAEEEGLAERERAGARMMSREWALVAEGYGETPRGPGAALEGFMEDAGAWRQ